MKKDSAKKCKKCSPFTLSSVIISLLNLQKKKSQICPSSIYISVSRHLQNICFPKNFVVGFLPMGTSVTKPKFSNFFRNFLVFKFSWICCIFASFKCNFASPKFQIKLTKIYWWHKYLRAIKPTTPFSRKTISSMTIHSYKKKLNCAAWGSVGHY